MDDGSVSSTHGSFVYKSELQDIRDKSTNITNARACMQCGYIELFLDAETLKERLA